MLDRRPPAPPLLRPQRRQGRVVLVGLVLAVLGLGGGLLLGLGLRHPPVAPPVAQQAAAPAAMPVPAAPVPAVPPGPDRTALEADLASLRASVAAEQARLNALREARQAAEADLATTRRELALAQAQASRREAAPPLPSVAQPPAPPIVLGAPPRPLTLPPGIAATPAPSAGSGQARVFLHMRAGSVAAADSAAELVPQLRDSGFEVADTRLVTSTPSQRVVRYFHTEDAAAAARLAGRLGRGWAIQDFRNYEPAPSSGTLEIWLPDR
ncbi:hypothetical protein JMJ55_01540 [Belnapia sp. T6]|uniref:LytR/CpsA/Psr regulator C-terminal domain-containing protein n=1 Tax=Belnapia mucosa TaxID=2804532 RepID=A0ABS1UWZ9_9PROT|nr:hypothetical protein [Belnapia mucosa]MBL6453984.1 hypothetical protein [Belnapia mucosa]